MTSPKEMRGFTIFELMITVAVAGVILTIGVPSFLSVIETNRAVTHTNELITSLNLARSEAVRRGAPILVCSSTDNATCSGNTDWSTGWIVLTQTATPEVLRVWPERTGGANILTGDVNRIQFQARGSLVPGATPQIQLRLPNCGENEGRDVDVNSAGRISVTRVDC